MNCLQRLAPQIRQVIETQRVKYPNTVGAVIDDLNSHSGYLELKYSTIHWLMSEFHKWGMVDPRLTIGDLFEGKIV
jgi:hypothetical protein